MKKKLYILILLSGILPIIACQKEFDEKSSDSRCVLIATIGESDSKVSFEDKGTSGIKLTWEPTDRIIGFWYDGETKRPVLFTIDKITNNSRRASFILSKGKNPGNNKLFLCCVPSNYVINLNEYSDTSEWKNITIDLSEQDGTNIKNYAYLCAEGEPSNGVLALNFINQYSVIKIESVVDLDYTPANYTFSSNSLKPKGYIGLESEQQTEFDFHPTNEIKAINITGNSSPIYIVVPINGEVELNDIQLTANCSTDPSQSQSISLGSKTISNGNVYDKGTITPIGFEWLKGEFTVAYNKKVVFAKGNLYLDNNSRWKFEKNQYNTRQYYDVTISGLTESNRSDMLPRYGYICNLNYEDQPFRSEFEETISILSSDEWTNLRKQGKAALATINDGSKSILGAVLLPDDFEDPFISVTTGGTNHKLKAMSISTGISGAYTDNTYDLSGWSSMEQAGAVFLPGGGYYTVGGGFVNRTDGYSYYNCKSNLTFHLSRWNFQCNSTATAGNLWAYVRLVKEVSN